MKRRDMLKGLTILPLVTAHRFSVETRICPPGCSGLIGDRWFPVPMFQSIGVDRR